VSAKLGPLTVRTDVYDLCEQVQCPMEPGLHTYDMVFPIPGGIPSVKLGFRSVSTTVDGREMSCTEGEFQIKSA
jgi:ML domain